MRVSFVIIFAVIQISLPLACCGQDKVALLPEFNPDFFEDPHSQEMYYLNCEQGSFKAAAGWAKEDSEPNIEAKKWFPEEEARNRVFSRKYGSKTDGNTTNFEKTNDGTSFKSLTPSSIDPRILLGFFLLIFLISCFLIYHVSCDDIDPFYAHLPFSDGVKNETDLEINVALIKILGISNQPILETEEAFVEVSRLCNFLKEKINLEQKKMILFATYRIFSLKKYSQENRENFYKRIQADLEIKFDIDENSKEYQDALKVLNVTNKITIEDLDKVYKLKLEMVNPEKVKDMDPEIQQLAQRKFKEAQKAYIELVNRIKA